MSDLEATAEAVDDEDDDDERCCGIDGLIVYVCICDDGCECACPGCWCEGWGKEAPAEVPRG
jgi:hypothetical protein